MTETANVSTPKWEPGSTREGPYEFWVRATRLPVYRGHYVQDARSAELG